MNGSFIFWFLVVNIASSTSRGVSLFVINLYAIHLGANAAELGLIRGLTGFGILLSVLPVGCLVDHFGAKRFYLLGELGGALLTVSLLFIVHPSELILQSAVMGISMAFRFTALQAMFLDEMSSFGSHKAGWYRGSTLLGAVFLGPLLGGYLVQCSSYQMIFLVTSACMLLSAIPAMLHFHERRQERPKILRIPTSERLAGFWRQLREIMGNRTMLHATMAEGLSSACYATFSVFVLALAMDRFKLPAHMAGNVVSAGGAAFIAMVMFGGILLRTGNYLPRLLGCFGGAIAGLLLLASATSTFCLLAGTMVLCISLGLLTLVTFTLVSRVEGQKGQVVGVYATSTSLGHTVVPILGGVVGKLFGPQTVFLSLVPLFLLFGVGMYLTDHYQEVLDE